MSDRDDTEGEDSDFAPGKSPEEEEDDEEEEEGSGSAEENEKDDDDEPEEDEEEDSRPVDVVQELKSELTDVQDVLDLNDPKPADDMLKELDAYHRLMGKEQSAWDGLPDEPGSAHIELLRTVRDRIQTMIRIFETPGDPETDLKQLDRYDVLTKVESIKLQAKEFPDKKHLLDMVLERIRMNDDDQAAIDMATQAAAGEVPSGEPDPDAYVRKKRILALERLDNWGLLKGSIKEKARSVLVRQDKVGEATLLNTLDDAISRAEETLESKEGGGEDTGKGEKDADLEEGGAVGNEKERAEVLLKEQVDALYKRAEKLGLDKSTLPDPNRPNGLIALKQTISAAEEEKKKKKKKPKKKMSIEPDVISPPRKQLSTTYDQLVEEWKTAVETEAKELHDFAVKSYPGTSLEHKAEYMPISVALLRVSKAYLLIKLRRYSLPSKREDLSLVALQDMMVSSFTMQDKKSKKHTFSVADEVVAYYRMHPASPGEVKTVFLLACKEVYDAAMLMIPPSVFQEDGNPEGKGTATNAIRTLVVGSEGKPSTGMVLVNNVFMLRELAVIILYVHAIAKGDARKLIKHLNELNDAASATNETNTLLKLYEMTLKETGEAESAKKSAQKAAMSKEDAQMLNLLRKKREGGKDLKPMEQSMLEDLEAQEKQAHQTYGEKDIIDLMMSTAEKRLGPDALPRMMRRYKMLALMTIIMDKLPSLESWKFKTIDQEAVVQMETELLQYYQQKGVENPAAHLASQIYSHVLDPAYPPVDDGSKWIYSVGGAPAFAEESIESLADVLVLNFRKNIEPMALNATRDRVTKILVAVARSQSFVDMAERHVIRRIAEVVCVMSIVEIGLRTVKNHKSIDDILVTTGYVLWSVITFYKSMFLARQTRAYSWSKQDYDMYEEGWKLASAIIRAMDVAHLRVDVDFYTYGNRDDVRAVLASNQLTERLTRVKNVNSFLDFFSPRGSEERLPEGFKYTDEGLDLGGVIEKPLVQPQQQQPVVPAEPPKPKKKIQPTPVQPAEPVVPTEPPKPKKKIQPIPVQPMPPKQPSPPRKPMQIDPTFPIPDDAPVVELANEGVLTESYNPKKRKLSPGVRSNVIDMPNPDDQPIGNLLRPHVFNIDNQPIINLMPVPQKQVSPPAKSPEKKKQKKKEKKKKDEGEKKKKKKEKPEKEGEKKPEKEKEKKPEVRFQIQKADILQFARELIDSGSDGVIPDDMYGKYERAKGVKLTQVEKGRIRGAMQGALLYKFQLRAGANAMIPPDAASQEIRDANAALKKSIVTLPELTKRKTEGQPLITMLERVKLYGPDANAKGKMYKMIRAENGGIKCVEMDSAVDDILRRRSERGKSSTDLTERQIRLRMAKMGQGSYDDETLASAVQQWIRQAGQPTGNVKGGFETFSFARRMRGHAC
jgi:hypothetical protein